MKKESIEEVHLKLDKILTAVAPPQQKIRLVDFCSKHGLAVATVREWIRLGQLSSFKIGGRIYLDELTALAEITTRP